MPPKNEEKDLSDKIKKWLPCDFSLWCDEPKYDHEVPLNLHKPWQINPS